MGWSIRRINIVDVIHACRQAGVAKLTYGDLEIAFGEQVYMQEAYVPSPVQVDLKQSTKGEVTPEQVDAVREDVLSRLLVEDPEAYEKLQTGDKE